MQKPSFCARKPTQRSYTTVYLSRHSFQNGWKSCSSNHYTQLQDLGVSADSILGLKLPTDPTMAGLYRKNFPPVWMQLLRWIYHFLAVGFQPSVKEGASRDYTHRLPSPGNLCVQFQQVLPARYVTVGFESKLQNRRFFHRQISNQFSQNISKADTWGYRHTLSQLLCVTNPPELQC